ncbi:MAG: hypothetical protein Greene071421_368 [Parcubacteria group bacterium Greene0714_21]|nr:MAG: hypothetical protein Greene041639_22 [Parcubacteria group bacterium Greene0416_39]TSC98352.1 MAG: hypothetical protein Greene101447_95 [Parcubacteria group bacterium Greene1014_47]TSD04002.1 MAG: hypothetical protein Greene071421_368 [Parcubacteria group bacterium Greene0714_21]
MKDASTQQFLEIEEVREGTLVLKDRAIRGVLMVSSQNFALKSGEEQEAIISQFQNFLNSLDFPLQIIIQSRRLNITGYLDYLKNLEEQQKVELLKQQTKSYREFVEQLISGPEGGKGGSIMAKNFFAIVPFSLLETVAEPGKSKFQKPKFTGKLSDEQFERMKNQLWQRMEFVALGLRRAGLQAVPLETQELIELLWAWHHPAEAEVGYYPEIPPEVLK